MRTCSQSSPFSSHWASNPDYQVLRQLSFLSVSPTFLLHQVFVFLLTLFSFVRKFRNPIAGMGTVTKWELPPTQTIKHKSFMLQTFADTKTMNSKFHTSNFTKSTSHISLCIVFCKISLWIVTYKAWKTGEWNVNILHCEKKFSLTQKLHALYNYLLSWVSVPNKQPDSSVSCFASSCLIFRNQPSLQSGGSGFYCLNRTF